MKQIIIDTIGAVIGAIAFVIFMAFCIFYLDCAP